MSWQFLRSVLLAKGFDGAYVHRFMSLVTAGHTKVSLNGTVGPYFANGRGLRQGDPISPLLFSFMADALSCILPRVADAGNIKAVASHLIPLGISRC